MAARRAAAAVLLLSVSLSTGAPLQGGPPPATLSDIDVLRDRYIAFFTDLGDCTQTQFCLSGGYMLPLEASGCEHTCGPAASASASLGPKGLWSDVNYTDRTTSVWEPTLHLERTLAMARAWRCPQCGSQHWSAALLKSTHTALTGWLSLNITGSQWWWSDIGTPQYLGGIALLLNDTLTTDELAGVVKVMNDAGDGTQGTGENMLWEQQIGIAREVLQRDPASAQKIAQLLWSHIAVTTGDGIQIDGSFHFHGALLYTGGYGADEAVQLASMCQLTSGLPAFAPPDDVFDVVAMYLLNGTQFLVRTDANGSFFDLSSKGREITRAPNGNLEFPSSVFVQSFNSSVFLKSRWGDEFSAFLSRIAGSGNVKPFVGARHYYRSDYTVVHRPAFMSSLKMCSTRMEANEITNGEGLLSGHTADGVLLYGVEPYLGIFPVWDWNTLPGTTSQPLDALDATNVKHYGASAFVGGCVEAGSGGVTTATMDYASNGKPAPHTDAVLAAKKSAVWLDAAVVALGTGVQLNGSTDPVVTTIDQRLLDGAVTVQQRSGSGAPATLPPGNHTLTGVAWVHHADTLHIVLPSPSGAVPTVRVRLGPQKGSWSLISQHASADTVTHDVFFAAIDHGEAPDLAGTYGYAVLPGVPLSGAADAAAAFASSTTVVAQTDAAHAVFYAGGTPSAMAAAPSSWVLAGSVRAPGTAITTPAGKVTVSAPCSFVLRADGGGGVTLTAASPAQLSGQLEVTVGSTSVASASATCRLAFPSGDVAGNAASAKCAA